jgi:hypothetical protein
LASNDLPASAMTVTTNVIFPVDLMTMLPYIIF